MSKKSKQSNNNTLIFTSIIVLIVLILTFVGFYFLQNRLNINPQSNETTFCGGIAGKSCPEGYWCKLDGKYPDAGGECQKKDLLHWNY
jgi:hypothetical protein